MLTQKEISFKFHCQFFVLFCFVCLFVGLLLLLLFFVLFCFCFVLFCFVLFCFVFLFVGVFGCLFVCLFFILKKRAEFYIMKLHKYQRLPPEPLYQTYRHVCTHSDAFSWIKIWTWNVTFLKFYEMLWNNFTRRELIYLFLLMLQLSFARFLYILW